jgi:DNA repair protein SbcD/Mre11
VRLLHTSDWHLGVQTMGHSRAADHDGLLAEIHDIAVDFKPHLILHTGDVWHSSRPAEADIQRGMSALAALGQVAPVVVVAGNHDSPALFQVFQTLVEATGAAGPRITFCPRVRRPDQGGILDFTGEPGERVRLAVIPYIRPGQIVDPFDDGQTWTGTYADTVREVEAVLDKGLLDGYDSATDVLLFAAHLHLHGARWSARSGMREVSVTEDYATLPESIPSASYSAFGHIHLPQEIPSGVGRYAGSILQVDFGEVGEEKSVVLVEAKPRKPVAIRVQPLVRARRLHRVIGHLGDLPSHAAEVGNGMALVQIECEQDIPDLAAEVQRRLPDAYLLDCIPIVAGRQPKHLGSELQTDEDVEPPLNDLYAEYLGRRGVRRSSPELAVRSFSALLTSVREHDPFVVSEEAGVNRALKAVEQVVAAPVADALELLQDPKLGSGA